VKALAAILRALLGYAYTGHGGAAAAPVRDGQRAGICRVAVQALADPREFG